MLLMLMVMVVEPVSLIEGDAHVRLDLWHRLSQYQARLVIVSPEKKHGCGLFVIFTKTFFLTKVML